MINQFGFHDDEIFLLSSSEFNLYKEGINKYCLHITSYWWLRDSGFFSTIARAINQSGDLMTHGMNIYYNNCGVRPAFDRPHTDSPIGSVEEFTLNGVVYPAIKIATKADRDLWLSDNIIDYRRFDASTNKYEDSEIRNWLLENYLYK